MKAKKIDLTVMSTAALDRELLERALAKTAAAIWEHEGRLDALRQKLFGQQRELKSRSR